MTRKAGSGKKAAQPWDEVAWWRERLDGSWRSTPGGGGKASCPVHADSSPSLVINPKPGGGVLVTCHGCHAAYVDILEALGAQEDVAPLEIRATTAQKAPERPPAASSPQAALEWLAGYCQVDVGLLEALGINASDGRIHYVMDGWDNHKVRTPNSKDHRWFLEKTPEPPLWPMPEGKLPKRIWVTEGETDCIALRGWGIPAFAMIRGADKPLSVPVLKELGSMGVHEIVVALDADEAGRSGAEKLRPNVVEAGLLLLEAIPPTYSPIRGSGKDWRAYRLAGGTLPEPKMLTIERDYANIAIEASKGVDWVVESFVGRDLITIVAGAPKAGKSTWVYNMLAAVMRGEPFMGHETTQGTALILSEEAPITIWLKAQGRLQGVTWITQSDAMAEGVDFLTLLSQKADEARRKGHSTICADTVAAWAMVADENDSAEVTKLLTTIRYICRGLAVILIHHTAKNGGEHGRAIRGSGAWLGSSDIGITIDWADDIGRHARKLSVNTRLQEEPEDVYVDQAGELIGTSREVKNEAALGLLQLIPTSGEGLLATEVQSLWHAHEGIEMSLATVKRKLTEGEAKGSVRALAVAVPGKPGKPPMRYWFVPGKVFQLRRKGS